MRVAFALQLACCWGSWTTVGSWHKFNVQLTLNPTPQTTTQQGVVRYDLEKKGLSINGGAQDRPQRIMILVVGTPLMGSWEGTPQLLQTVHISAQNHEGWQVDLGEVSNSPSVRALCSLRIVYYLRIRNGNKMAATVRFGV